MISINANAHKPNYPYNCWWVAGFAAEITNEFLARRILERPVLLYRTTSGEVVALDDRCPHRSMALSGGKREGDNVVCAYHGFQFAPNGKCVKIPSQSSTGALSIRSYPVRELGPFVWIYMGDLERLDETPPPPDHSWMTDPAYKIQMGNLQIDGNYMILNENVLDLTHLGYVHASTLNTDIASKAAKTISDGDMIGYEQNSFGIPLPPFFAKPLRLAQDDLVDLRDWGRFLSPGLVLGAWDIRICQPREGQRVEEFFRICHATTPIDHKSMHYWWVYGWTFNGSEQDLTDFGDLTFLAFQEDRFVIETIQRMYDLDPRSPDFMECAVAADGAGVSARRMIDKWLAREQT